MLSGVTHATARRTYVTLQKSIQQWGNGDDALDRLGDMLAKGRDVSQTGDEDAGLRFAGKFAGKLLEKKAAAEGDEPDLTQGSEASDGCLESSGDKQQHDRQKRSQIGLYGEAMGDYHERAAEAQQWCGNHCSNLTRA
eukprot:SAG31_NODE_1459_length_8254_cov_4.297854_6_plen_138_part_00